MMTKEEDVVEVFVEKNIPLVITFSGTGPALGALPRHDFKKFLNENYTGNYISLRDRSQTWYQKGVCGIGDDISSILHFLNHKIESFNPSKILCMGLCGGAYAALLFSSLLKTDICLAISPRTILSDDNCLIFAERSKEMSKDSPYDDVLNFNFSDKTHIYVFHGKLDKKYDKQVNRLKCLKNLHFSEYDGVGHTAAAHVLDKGILKKLFREFFPNNYK